MIHDWIHIVRCPGCYGTLEPRELALEQRVVKKGVLVCKSCSLEYPIIDGIAFLAVIDNSWAVILKELIARHEIVARDVSQVQIEKDREQVKQQQTADVGVLMDDLFDFAIERLNLSNGPLVVDVGAGSCKTSRALTEKGAVVFSTETEISNLAYLNFEALRHDPSEEIVFNGRTFYYRNPDTIPVYFSTVVCDVQRLPFEDGIFDAALCRSVLHHIQSCSKAIKEMVRVVKTGGDVMFISEPIRAVFDKESDHLRGVFDKEEGLNEHCPTLLHYTLPLFRFADRIQIHYRPTHTRSVTKKIFDLLNYNYEKHLRADEVVSGWRIAKLLFTGASINLYAKRNKKKVKKPKTIDPRQLSFSISDIARVYFDFDNTKSLEGITKHTDELKSIRLSLLNRSSIRLPSTVKVGHPDLNLLESGWREPTTYQGDAFRYTMLHAKTLIGSAKEKSLTLEIIVGNSGLTGVSEGKIVLDSEELGKFECRENTWQKLRFEFDNKLLYTVHLLEIRNTILSPRKESEPTPNEYGVAVKEIRIVRS